MDVTLFKSASASYTYSISLFTAIKVLLSLVAAFLQKLCFASELQQASHTYIISSFTTIKELLSLVPAFLQRLCFASEPQQAISRHCPNKLAYAKMCRVRRKIEIIFGMQAGVRRTSSLYCFPKMKDFVSAIFIDAVLKFD
ncbi:hypothetical protein Patl1_07073 [Pistacia atlantica]|uniref:Uncharacterized protein n=1 Tax=Pistacia atlantica TaxID=434234 RepID=A0ACC1AJH0_9ROSI|nr:hypothetical protein Patl1_07073 [Pistacia atlantica]